MSWAEIKKVNSDLSLPLNDLILDTSDNCVRGLKTITGATDYMQNTRISPGTKTIANVTGKGKIVNCLFYCSIASNGEYNTSEFPVANNVTFKLTIDNEIVLHIKRKINLTPRLNYYTFEYMGLLNLKGIYYDYDNFNKDGYNPKPLNYISLDTQGANRRRKLIDLSSDLQEFTDDSLLGAQTSEYLVLSEKCIRFNKNFKLEIIVEDKYINAYDYLITYKLED